MTRPKSKLPFCVACLYRVGWGIKRVCRHTGFSKTTVHRFAKLHGLTDAVTGEAKRAAFDKTPARGAVSRARSTGKTEARRKLAEQKRELREMGPHLPKRNCALEWYYANHEANKAKARAAAKARYHSKLKRDPAFKAKVYARNAALWAEKKARLGIKDRIRSPIALSGFRRGLLVNRLRKRFAALFRSRGKKINPLTGCTGHFLAAYIESQFKPGMGWHNRSAWHVDHIKPCAAFDLSDPVEISLCFHWTNLRPLWAEENITKGAKAA